MAQRLPTIDDEGIADLIEQLALLVVDRDEEVAALRSVLSVSLDLLRKEQTTNERRRAELYRLRDELRTSRPRSESATVPSELHMSLYSTRKSHRERSEKRSKKR